MSEGTVYQIFVYHSWVDNGAGRAGCITNTPFGNETFCIEGTEAGLRGWIMQRRAYLNKRNDPSNPEVIRHAEFLDKIERLLNHPTLDEYVKVEPDGSEDENF